jgi:hypothetical protein
MELRYDGSVIKLIALATLAAAVAVTAGILLATAHARSYPTAVGQLALFQGPGDAALPDAVSEAIKYMPTPDTGDAVPGKARLLRGHLNASGAAIYAFPTTKGAVCFVVTEGTTPGTCVNRFDRSAKGIPVAAMSYWTQGSPLTVAGIMPPGVTGVTLKMNGRSFRASASGRTFYAQTDDFTGQGDVEALVVQYADGSTLTRSNH